MIIDICENYGSRLLKVEEAEDLWLFSIENIYQIKQVVMDSDDLKDEDDLQKFQIFLLTRIQAFMMRLAEFVQLDQIITFLQKIGQSNTYAEFKPTFEEKVKRETYHENILNNAADLIYKDMMTDTMTLDSHRVSTFYVLVDSLVRILEKRMCGNRSEV